MEREVIILLVEEPPDPDELVVDAIANLVVFGWLVRKAIEEARGG